MDSIVLQAVRDNPRIIHEIIEDPDNHLNHHRMSIIEYMALNNIQRQAFGKRRFATACPNRHRTYRNWLSVIEREALRQEQKIMQTSFLKGYQIYEEIARRMSIKFKSRYHWRDIKSILEYASEVIADLELTSNAKLAMVA